MSEDPTTRAACPLYDPPPLRIARLRCELRPATELRLPVEQRGNALRGALGMNLRRAVCDPACDDPRSCARGDACPYARLFEPRSPQGASFGAGEAPRPFLFRPPLDPDPAFGPRRPLVFELRLFGSAIHDAAHFVLPLLDLGRTGLAGRSVELTSVVSLDWMGRAARVLVEQARARDASPLQLDLDWSFEIPSDGSRARIELLTPTRLPMRRNTSARETDRQAPTMAALVRRIRDRLSFLSLIWADEEWRADYGTIGALADRAITIAAEGRPTTYTRQSTKTGQTMYMTGYRGTVTYDRVDDRLWPLLRIGQEIHAGRFTEWGLGQYRIEH